MHEFFYRYLLSNFVWLFYVDPKELVAFDSFESNFFKEISLFFKVLVHHHTCHEMCTHHGVKQNSNFKKRKIKAKQKPKARASIFNGFLFAYRYSVVVQALPFISFNSSIFMEVFHFVFFACPFNVFIVKRNKTVVHCFASNFYSWFHRKFYTPFEIEWMTKWHVHDALIHTVK